ncbi:MAG: 8-oxo-dGTP diphosphatase [Crocinitomix sp.]|jgi:8-oxo-dGTP diphosphatase
MDLNYQHNLNKGISVDCVIFGFDFEKLKVLVIQREPNDEPSKARFSLPGDLIYDDETLDEAATRVLKELTGLENIFLEQLGAFSSLDRLSKSADKEWLRMMRELPEERVITVAYFALVNLNAFNPMAANFAKTVSWKPVDEIDSMAFDHFEILQKAHHQLHSKLKIQPIGFNLLPEKFTLSQLHKLYEVIAGKELDKRNFRRKMIKLKIVEKLDEKQKGVPHKPSNFYHFNVENYQKLAETGFDNFGF